MIDLEMNKPRCSHEFGGESDSSNLTLAREEYMQMTPLFAKIQSMGRRHSCLHIMPKFV